METCPCQHECLITYADNTTKTSRLSGWELVKNKYFLFLDDRFHFLYMKKFMAKFDDANYSEFKKYVANYVVDSDNDEDEL